MGDWSYLKDTLGGTTKPHRVTWGMVFLLNSISFANQYASGADNSLWMFGAVVLATGTIFVASLKNGVGGHTKKDILTIIISSGGAVLWLLFDRPLLSILANVFAVVVAVSPTIVKAKKDPESETRIAYLLGLISSVLALISVGKLDYELLILPANGAVLQIYLVYLLYFKPKRTIKQKAP